MTLASSILADLPLGVAAQRDKAMAQVEENAGSGFMARAKEFMLDYFEVNGEMPGEDASDACIKAGIEPHDQRAFGPVFKALIKAKKIERVGFCLRKKGHLTGGGSVYRIVP